MSLCANHVSANYVCTKKLCVADIDVLAELQRLQARVNELERQLGESMEMSLPQVEVVSVETVDEKVFLVVKSWLYDRIRAGHSALCTCLCVVAFLGIPQPSRSTDASGNAALRL